MDARRSWILTAAVLTVVLAAFWAGTGFVGCARAEAPSAAMMAKDVAEARAELAGTW